MNKLSAVLPLLVLNTLAAALPLRAEEAAPSPELAFAKLTDEILADEFNFQPLNAVGLGLHQFDGKFVDFSRAAIDAEIRRVHDFKTRLERHRCREAGRRVRVRLQTAAPRGR